MRSLDVAIIGGGVSGLAAAVGLAHSGKSVGIFEQGPRLGGRCYSYIDETTGDTVENGQHVLLGAYHETLRYLELVGTRSFLKAEPSLVLPLHHPKKGLVTFRMSALPRPFHLTVGMLKFDALSLADRRRLLNAGMVLRKLNKSKERDLAPLTIEEWLTHLKQSAEVKRTLWYPVALSVMNELPERASALLFARSLRAAFLGSVTDSAMLLPTIGQTALYVDGAVDIFQRCGIAVHCRSEVCSIEIDRGRVDGIRLADGKLIRTDRVIAAVPHHALPALFRSTPDLAAFFRPIGQIPSSPIISIHCWFDRDFMAMDYLGVIGKNLQWIFNRRRILAGQHGRGGYISAVISGAHAAVAMPKKVLVDTALDELHQIFSESRDCRLTHSVVIKEKRATFSPTPSAESLRPDTRTSLENLFLAGDWTNTGLPATIEGAVKSGFRAAELAGGA